MQLETCSHKLIGINRQFEADQYFTQNYFRFVNYQQNATHKSNAWDALLGERIFAALLRSNKDWFKSVLQVHTPFKHGRKSSCRLKF